MEDEDLFIHSINISLTGRCVYILRVSGDKSFEMRVLEDKHREEVAALKKKLQWFAENQELLDRDAGRLKAATTEIHQLKEQVAF